MLTPLLEAFSPVLLVGQAGGGSGGAFGLLLPLLLIGAVFYFFIYRPQQKREEEHQEMVDNLEQGDKIVSIGGIHGTIQRLDEESVIIQVGSKGTTFRIDKDAISRSENNDE